jgi:hypothetical protein
MHALAHTGGTPVTVVIVATCSLATGIMIVLTQFRSVRRD